MPGSHDHVLEYVDGYLHDALTPEEAARVEAHCQWCRICQVALEEARHRCDAMQALPVVEASEELIRATQQRIEKTLRRRLSRAQKGCLLAAAAALVIGVVHVYYATLSPSAYDLKVLGQTQWLAGSDASLRVLVVDRSSGEAVEDVPVEIELVAPGRENVIQLASFNTDRFGSAAPRLCLPDWETGEYQLRVRARAGRTPELITRTVELRRCWQLMLSTDKPVYQPGQVIHARSLGLRRPDLKPVAGHEVVFSVTDPKGNVIFRRRDVTSRYGIASIDCPLATEIIEGPYQVRSEVGDTSGSVTVKVEKYVLPKFKVDVELDQPYYQPGQRVRGKVQADYFFGKPVAGAEVQIDVRTTIVRPTVVHQASVQTDEQGAADFEFDLPPSLVGREQDAGDAQFMLVVTVRDTAGQKHAKGLSRIVTAQPIRVEVIPEAGTLVRGVANTVYFFTSYPDGRPARTRIAISGMDQEVATSDLGVASIELTPEQSPLRWTLRATDDDGKIGRRGVILRCGQPTGDFLVRTDKAVYDGGQTMHVVALGGGSEPVFLDLIQDGQTMLTDVVEMADGRGRYELDLPPELFGTVELVAYRYGLRGLPVSKRRVIYVRQPGALQIEIGLDQEQYRPGDRARLDFTLTDDRGRPAPGALSLAAVDEAVFSVLAQKPGLEQTFFTLEEELLEPIYAIYRWSPEFSSSPSRQDEDQFQQALFARTARGRDARDGVFGGLHSLKAESFPDKARQVRAARQRGFVGVTVAWIALGVLGGLAFLVYLCRTVPILGAIAVTVVVMLGGLVVLAALLLPAVQSAREASTRAAARNNLRQIGLGLTTHDLSKSPMDAQTGRTTPPARVRQWFPETLLWRPELITDDNGRASIDVDLADSITTWRLTTSAVSAEGKLGGTQGAIRVFQPFFVDLNLPVALTRGDEVAVPAVVYNYLDQPQTVRLTLADAEWFELREDQETEQQLELAAGEVRSISYRLAARKVGRHELQIDARGSGLADAIKRQIEVVPDGRRVEQVTNGTLQQPAEIECSVPEEAIEGSAKAIVKIYPSSFSQLVEGLDAIFRRPYGCFEQTSSTTYPNVLALDYLQRTNKSAPEIEAKARQYIHLGYQRLLSFEVDGGGFDWFGSPPANRTLTAYGLMEFEDMARVHDVDPRLIERTRQWLLQQQRRDGSWEPEGHQFHGGPARSRQLAVLSTTAYVAWAVFTDHEGTRQSQAALDYLSAHEPASIDDPYVLALVGNALATLDPTGQASESYLGKLDSLKQSSDDGQLVWWEQVQDGQTLFYGGGRSGQVETTALAALAMIRTNTHPQTARRALAWLVEQKDAAGTWHSTQATVLALKALLAGTGKPLGGEKPRQIEIAVDGKVLREVRIPADQADVMRQVDLSAALGQGTHRLTVSERSDTAAGYQVALSYYLPEEGERPEQEPLSIEIAYDKTELTVRDTLTATVTLVNNLPTAAPMVIVDLPIPAGFAIEADDLTALATTEAIGRYQLTPRSAIVYLRFLEPSQPLQLQYRLRATMPVRVTAPPVRAYEYYDPDKKVVGAAAELTVLARK